MRIALISSGSGSQGGGEVVRGVDVFAGESGIGHHAA